MQQHTIEPGQMFGDHYLLRPIEVEYEPGEIIQMKYSLGHHTVESIGENIEAAAANMLVNLAVFYGSLMRDKSPRPVGGLNANAAKSHSENMRIELSDFIGVIPDISK